MFLTKLSYLFIAVSCIVFSSKAQTTSLIDEKVALQFLDSVAKISIDNSIGIKLVDSTLHQSLRNSDPYESVSKEEIESLMNSSQLPIDEALRLFSFLSETEDYDSSDSVYLKAVLSPNYKTTKVWVLVVKPSETSWVSDIIFLEGGRFLQHRKNFSKYGLDVKWYSLNNGMPIFSFTENFESGTGAHWDQYFLYAYSKGEIIPAGTFIRKAVQANNFFSRMYVLEGELKIGTDIQYSYEYSIDFTNERMEEIHFERGKGMARASWDEGSGTFIIHEEKDSKWHLKELSAFYLTLDEYPFIKARMEALKLYLHGNAKQKKAVLAYLTSVREYTE